MVDNRDQKFFDRRDDRREGQPRPKLETLPPRATHQPIEPANNSATKVIVVFVLGFVAGFAVSQTFFATFQTDTSGVPTDEEVGGYRRSDADAAKSLSGTPGERNMTDTLGVSSSDGTGKGETASSIGKITFGPSAITIESQSAGTAVVVKRLVLGERSWVVIHEDERGRPGRILGAGRFTSGAHADVFVELLRNTVSGGVYYGMIHIDDGDDMFDSKLDTHLPDETGSPIMVRFSAL